MSDDLPDHSNYSIIKAVDESGNLVTVLCDASGAIVSVMKGDYAGDLKTLAVDDKGRIQAVLTDPEDVFGNPNYIGAGELAARLGSIKSFEYRGNVVFMDDFEASTLKWTVTGNGTGYSGVRSNATALSGNYSLKLSIGTDVGTEVSMTHKHFMPVKKRLGFEYSFALSSDLYLIYSNLDLYTATNLYEPSVLYNPITSKLQLVDENNVLQDIATSLVLEENDMMFHTWKLVVDLGTAKYCQVYLDDVEYDISSYGFRDTGGAYTSKLDVNISIRQLTVANQYAYIDNVIFTQNEP